MTGPLVSILVPNYNYGRFLPACLESALNQTYENLEVVFVDNDSTDDSYEIAQDFRRRYGDRLRVYRNDENVGGSGNARKACSRIDPRSQCIIYLSSDDFFHTTMIERCVGIMEAHPSVGFVITHRRAIDEHGRITEEIPFYNCDCVIPSTEQMEVFMMAGIGVSTQCFRNRHVDSRGNILGYNFDIAGDWFSNFILACESDMGYIQDALCTYRTHTTNVTSQAVRNLTNSIEHVLLIQAFHDIALSLERPSVARRLEPARVKLGSMCLRYAAQLLGDGDPSTARRYLHLGPVLRRDLRDDPAWATLWNLSGLEGQALREGVLAFEASSPQTRRVSYDPPPGAIRL
jgi:glycosyltransferase involved in cell wall biosynthesis